MKKTFWGYDVREADEVIDSLRSQNSILSSKLTKLNMELAAKSEMETPAPAAAVPEDMRRELEELRAAPLPLKMPLRPDYKAGTFRSQGFETPTGKLELCSTLIQGLGRPDLDPLPTYRSSFDGAAAEDFPLTLICGARLPHAIHSRLHEVPWVRSLRPEPTADLHPQDAQRRGVAEGDLIQLSTANGTIRVRAHLTHTGLPGDVYLYHGYREANANDLLPADHLDPYSGFPGFRQTRCQIRKADD